MQAQKAELKEFILFQDLNQWQYTFDYTKKK